MTRPARIQQAQRDVEPSMACSGVTPTIQPKCHKGPTSMVCAMVMRRGGWSGKVSLAPVPVAVIGR
jgi:hypothetical protein